MANRIEGKYIASEFLGSLETDVFEVAPGQYVHVEQHRHAQDHVYKMGEREIALLARRVGVAAGKFPPARQPERRITARRQVPNPND